MRYLLLLNPNKKVSQMKQYEYKYIKTEATLMTAGTQKAIDADEAMLIGYGLDGWRVHSLVQSYYLMEREISPNMDKS